MCASYLNSLLDLGAFRLLQARCKVPLPAIEATQVHLCGASTGRAAWAWASLVPSGLGSLGRPSCAVRDMQDLFSCRTGAHRSVYGRPLLQIAVHHTFHLVPKHTVPGTWTAGESVSPHAAYAGASGAKLQHAAHHARSPPGGHLEGNTKCQKNSCCLTL